MLSNIKSFVHIVFMAGNIQTINSFNAKKYKLTIQKVLAL